MRAPTIAAAPGGLPPSAYPAYVVAESWQGSPTGWSKQNNALLVDFVNATTPIEGTQSLFVQGDSGSTLPPYAYRSAPFGEIDDCYAFFLLKCTVGPTADDFSRELMWLADYPANNHNLALELYRFSSTDYRLRIWSGVTGTATTAAGFTLGSTIAVWLRYQKGSGANARADVWWTPATDLNNLVKPADGSNWHAHRDDGNITTSIEQIQLGAILRGGHGTEARYDRVLVLDSAIGDNPVMPPSYTTVHEQNVAALASTIAVGFDANTYYAGQVGWDPGANITVGKISVLLTAVGTVESHNYKCEIWTMSGGNLGAQVGVSVANKGNSGWSASAVEFNFFDGVALSNGTQYAIVVTKNAVHDGVNYINLHRSAAGGMSGTSASFTSGGVSATTSTGDVRLVIYK